MSVSHKRGNITHKVKNINKKKKKVTYHINLHFFCLMCYIAFFRFMWYVTFPYVLQPFSQIKVGGINSGDCLKTLGGHTDFFNCIKVLYFKVISWSKKGELKIWCLNTNSCIKSNNAHSDSTKGIHLLSIDKLISCSTDSTIKLWDVTTSSIQQMLTKDQ
jgi:WD40 repeat protein